MQSDERYLPELLREPREDLDVEIKSWLDLNDVAEHKAILAKALIALANHGGGFVLLGFELANDGVYREAAGRPENLAVYDQDTINGIVTRYAEPNFHCGLEFVAQPETGSQFPIVLVPAGTVPIRSKRAGPERRGIEQNLYYIRRPGPASEPPQNAQEWNNFIHRCTLEHRAGLAESFRNILFGEVAIADPNIQADTWALLDTWIADSLGLWRDKCNDLPTESSARCPFGYWWAAYQILPIGDPVNLGELRRIMAHERVRYSGWPPWPTLEGAGIPINDQADGIESWLGQNDPQEGRAVKADYWRANPQGVFFQLRGHQEDSGEIEPDQPGSTFSLVWPIWRTAECVLHAHAMANRLAGEDEDATILFCTGWTGLQDRWLRAPQRMVLGFDARRWSALEDDITLKVSLKNGSVRDNLIEIVWQLLGPLYERFEFYELPIDLVRQELELMLRRHV